MQYGEPEKIEKSFAFNVDIFILTKEASFLLKLYNDYGIIIRVVYCKQQEI